MVTFIRTIEVISVTHRTGDNSLLARAGVPLRVRQALMRHSPRGLTDGTYCDLRPLDDVCYNALDELPVLTLELPDQSDTDQLESMQATGTTDVCYVTGQTPEMQFVPGFVPTAGQSGTNRTNPDKLQDDGKHNDGNERSVVTAVAANTKHPPTTHVNSCPSMEPMGIEPTTSCMPCN